MLGKLLCKKQLLAGFYVVMSLNFPLRAYNFRITKLAQTRENLTTWQRLSTTPSGSFWGIPLRDRRVFSLEFSYHIWQSALPSSASAHCLALCLQRRSLHCAQGLLPGQLCPRRGWGGAVHSPNHFSISCGSVLQMKAAKEEETISIPAKKPLIFHLGKMPVEKGTLFPFWLSKPDCSSNSTPVASSCANTSKGGKTGRRLYSTSYHSSLWPSSLKKQCWVE